jgi:hypothetical protein
VQREDGIVGAERFAAQKLDAPCGFVAGLFDEGDVGTVDDVQQQVEFGEPDGQFFAVFEDPAVDVGVGVGADVAAGEQVLQGPAGAVGEFRDVAVEARPALNGRAVWSTWGSEEKSMSASVVTCTCIPRSAIGWTPQHRSRLRHVRRGTAPRRRKNSPRHWFADVSGMSALPRHRGGMVPLRSMRHMMLGRCPAERSGGMLIDGGE